MAEDAKKMPRPLDQDLGPRHVAVLQKEMGLRGGPALRGVNGQTPDKVGGSDEAGPYGPSRFADERRPFPKEGETDFGSEENETSSLPDMNFEHLPTEPPTMPVDPDKPNGPNLDELRPLIAADQKQREDFRRARRESFLDLPDDMSEEDREEKIGAARKTASPETQKVYLARGRSLLARYKRETRTRIPLEDIDPREFVNWLLGLVPTLTRGTWRNYRAAAAAIIQSIPSQHIDAAMGLLNADLMVGEDEGRGGRHKDPRDKDAVGATLRAKRMAYQHFEHLRRSLPVVSRSQATEWLQDWLDAGINTGLRPAEWAITVFERRPDSRFLHGERIWLHVVNAKAADGRGTHRTLDISNFGADTLGAVERMVERSRDWMLTGKFAQRQGEVSRLLRDACKVLFPRMQLQYTLYSLRHQFIANMKTIYDRAELAAMVGHISIDTHVEHYGKRRASWSKHEITEIPIPMEEQVTQVRKRLELFDQRRAITAAKEAARASAAGRPINDAVGYEPGDEDLEGQFSEVELESESRHTASDVDPSVDG